MKAFPYLLLPVFALSLLTSQAEDAVSRQDLQTVRSELVKAINEDRASISTANQERHDFTVKTTGELLALQESLATVTQQLKAANERIAQLEQSNKELRDQLTKQLTALQKLITEESRQRVAADQQIVDGVTKAVKDVAAAATPPAPAPAPAGATDNTPYRVYKVVRGDTLSTISQACGIGIERIKTFNGLKSDTIYEGQQLKIPEK